MSANLPALLIVVPLMLAPIAALTGRWRIAWVVAVAASWWAFGASIVLLQRVRAEGIIHYSLGGWAAPTGIEYRIDLVSAFVAVIVATIGAVTVLYVVLNAAFLYTLGHQRMAASPAVANDAISTVFPEYGGRLISLLICISALGVVNGLVFTGARISYALSNDHKTFGLLGRWNPKTETPAIALAVQGGLSLFLIIILGSFM